MDIKTLEELQGPDDRAGYFTPFGLGRASNAEAVALYHQQVMERLELAAVVPERVRAAFDQLRDLYIRGVLWYDLFTVAHDRARLILEYALRERFLDFYSGTVTFLDPAGVPLDLHPTDFDALFEEMRSRRLRNWSLSVDATGRRLRFDGMLDSLLRWARTVGLLRGQRNLYHETLLKTSRNQAAHGTGYHLLDPDSASLAISDLAEIINRLWGATTPGGRLYPAPLRREVAGIAWSGDSEIGWGLAKHVRTDVESGAWTCVLVRAEFADDVLPYFDAQFETTRSPCELLWGPGTPQEAAAWLGQHNPAGDEIDNLDRHFMVRHHDGQLYPPRNPEIAAGLTPPERIGTWYLMRADSPFEVFNHRRQLLAGESGCTDEGHCRRPWAPCPVETLAIGSWQDMLDKLADGGAPPAPRVAPDVRVPSEWPRWNENLVDGPWAIPAA